MNYHKVPKDDGSLIEALHEFVEKASNHWILEVLLPVKAKGATIGITNAFTVCTLYFD
jgi:hypothetical protein